MVSKKTKQSKTREFICNKNVNFLPEEMLQKAFINEKIKGHKCDLIIPKEKNIIYSEWLEINNIRTI